jgi:outer membrane lipoprotein-sorting protein
MRAFNFNRRGALILLSTILALLVARPGLADSPPVGQLIPDMVKHYAKVSDYTCKLDKRVRKNGVLHEDLAIAVKYRKPGQYYFHWEQGPARGREVIYVQGRNENRLVAHPGGVLRFLTLRLDPAGHLAMKANRHSLQHSGMDKIIEQVEADYDRARKMGIDAIRCTGEGRFGDKAVWIIEGAFPADNGFYARKVILLLDQAMGLPVKISIFGASDRLVEEYAFQDLKFNTGLTEDDFNPANPEYHYFQGPFRRSSLPWNGRFETTPAAGPYRSSAS